MVLSPVVFVATATGVAMSELASRCRSWRIRFRTEPGRFGGTGVEMCQEGLNIEPEEVRLEV